MYTVNDVMAKANELVEKYQAENGIFEGDELSALKSKMTIRAKALLKAEAREANVKVLIQFAKDYAGEDNVGVLEAVKALTEKVKGTRTITTKNGHITPRGAIAELFINVGDCVSESDIFNKFRMGRGEMKGAIKLALQKASPADRKWVAFDPDSESYTLLSIGPDAPDSWTGFLPISKE